MYAFIGWSGQRGLSIANALKAWLGQGVPELNCLISPDLPKGRDWFPELARWLNKAQLGLMCLAPPNVTGEWQLIEAGAVWKATRKGGLFPICFGVSAAEVAAPLREFQLTQFNRDDFLRLASSVVQQALGAEAWTAQRALAFETAWPTLQQAVDAALGAADPSVHTPRGFMHELAGGCWERLTSPDGSTRLSWMRLMRSSDGARIEISGDGCDDEGKPAASWHTEFVTVDDVAGATAKVRYYWAGRHTRGANLNFGGVGDLTFFIDEDHRVLRCKGEFTDVCLDEARHPATKLVELRRASADEIAVMDGADPQARRQRLRDTLGA